MRYDFETVFFTNFWQRQPERSFELLAVTRASPDDLMLPNQIVTFDMGEITALARSLHGLCVEDTPLVGTQALDLRHDYLVLAPGARFTSKRDLRRSIGSCMRSLLHALDQQAGCAQLDMLVWGGSGDAQQTTAGVRELTKVAHTAAEFSRSSTATPPFQRRRVAGEVFLAQSLLMERPRIATARAALERIRPMLRDFGLHLLLSDPKVPVNFAWSDWKERAA